jgi:hypothetical protein
VRLSAFLLSELDLEATFTRKHLERVPMERADFKLREKSMTLGWLATFLAIMPTWGAFTLTLDSFDVAPEGPRPPERRVAESRDQLLAMFDTNLLTVRTALQGTTDERLAQPWSLLSGGKAIFTRPRALVFETYFLNHMVHHRAQLGVYLRACDVPVPAVYNGSADEQGGMFMEAASR